MIEVVCPLPQLKVVVVILYPMQKQIQMLCIPRVWVGARAPQALPHIAPGSGGWGGKLADGGASYYSCEGKQSSNGLSNWYPKTQKWMKLWSHLMTKELGSHIYCWGQEWSPDPRAMAGLGWLSPGPGGGPVVCSGDCSGHCGGRFASWPRSQPKSDGLQSPASPWGFHLEHAASPANQRPLILPFSGSLPRPPHSPGSLSPTITPLTTWEEASYF